MNTSDAPARPALDRLTDGGQRLSVGMMTADLLRLGAELASIEQSGVELVHIDVMDGIFCPPLTAGPPVIKAMKTHLLKDVHLMVHEPLEKVDAYVAAGADLLTIHVESTIHPHRVLQALGRATNANDAARGLIRGIALNPGTPLQTLDPLLDEVEYVLLLAVNPGWSGQSFIPATERRLEAVRETLLRTGRRLLLGIDGGVTKENVGHIASLGPDIIVVGSAVFDGRVPVENARYMQTQIQEARARR